MTYSEELLGRSAGQKLSSGPPASDAHVKFAPAASSFQRPGPEVLSATIPVVFVGRNRRGLWVARDGDGRFGGLFWHRDSAMRFAKRNAAPGGCAVVFPQARFELDLENRGNPVIAHLGHLWRLLARRAHRLIAMSRKTPAISSIAMTILTRHHDLSRRPARQRRAADRASQPSEQSRETAMRGFFRFAVTILLGAAALAAIIALKTAIYLPHINV